MTVKYELSKLKSDDDFCIAILSVRPTHLPRPSLSRLLTVLLSSCAHLIILRTISPVSNVRLCLIQEWCYRETSLSPRPRELTPPPSLPSSSSLCSSRNSLLYTELPTSQTHAEDSRPEDHSDGASTQLATPPVGSSPSSHLASPLPSLSFFRRFAQEPTSTKPIGTSSSQFTTSPLASLVHLNFELTSSRSSPLPDSLPDSLASTSSKTTLRTRAS